jgi:23S rRNA pseudouridine2457 synthase
VLIAFHKPFGVLSQFTGDGSPNRTLAEFGFPKNVYPIGRLDADSEGLLLLSDEPAWNEKLLHPRHAHEREYWAQVEKSRAPEAEEVETRRGDSRPENPALPRVAAGAAAGNADAARSGSPHHPPRNPPISAKACRIAGLAWNWSRAKTARCGG